MQTSCTNVTETIDNINNYAFKFNFTDSTNGNYIRVPLSAFVTDKDASYNTCRFYV